MKAHLNLNDLPEDKKNELAELLEKNDLMESIFEGFDAEGDSAAPLRAALSAVTLPDEEFSIVSNSILSNFDKTLHKANNALVLTQALNANGLTVEDFNESFLAFSDALEKEFASSLTPAKVDYIKALIGLLGNAINETEGIPHRTVSIPIQLTHPDAKMPEYQKVGDAGMDVYAVEDVTINPGETKIIPTGIKVALPYGYELQVRPRSGLSVKTPLRVANAPGTIDCGYKDEIGVIITNIEPEIKNVEFDRKGKVKSYEHGQSYTITKGMRFAQLVLMPVPTALFYEVEDVSILGAEDRKSGFGGTGNG